jgi:hypothetical protein
VSSVAIQARANDAPGAARFAAAAGGFAVVAAVIAGWAPVELSIAAVLLFAGPHNWIEARYFLARLPGRWGRSRAFFSLAIGGSAALAASYVALVVVGGAEMAVAGWNTAAVLWVAAVGMLHARQTGRDWGWLAPAALVLVAAIWQAPYHASLALVYLHPLVSLWFVDRELRRRPAWRSAYRVCLVSTALLVVALWARLAGAPPIAGDDGLTLRIVQHAGADLLPGVSSRALVATHVFLETIHYGVWLAVMPIVGFRTAFWRFDSLPLARRSQGWSAAVRWGLVAGAAAVVVLWACFAVDYTTTRDVYFTLAMLHVLAEAPFLVRLL